MRLLILLVLLLSCSTQKPQSPQPTEKKRDITTSTTADSIITPTYKVATMSIDTPKIVVKGTRTIKSVEDEIKTHLISVNYWYQRTPLLNKKRTVIIVGFSINELGVPSEITLHNASHDSGDFIQKVVKDIEKWRFAQMYDGAGITEVVYPIILEPSKPLQL